MRELVIQEWLALRGEGATDVVPMPAGQWFDTLGICQGFQLVLKATYVKNASVKVYTAPRFDGPAYGPVISAAQSGMASVPISILDGSSRASPLPITPVQRFFYWQVESSAPSWEAVFRATVRLDPGAAARSAAGLGRGVSLRADNVGYTRIAADSILSTVTQDSRGWIRTSGLRELIVEASVLSLVNAKLRLQTAQALTGPWHDVRDIAVSGPVDDYFVLTRDSGTVADYLLQNYVRWQLVRTAAGDFEGCFRITTAPSL